MASTDRALPRGTVTFLFTDIERSTANAAALGDERYADVQDAHRKLLRDAFAAHGGVEVATEGDAFFVAFARAIDAARAATAGQTAMATHGWEQQPLLVRMGLHTGEALIRHGDYVGVEVNRAKRIANAAHGGQIVLSQTTRELIAGHLPPDHAVVDLGPHRLKDFDDPQRLYQLNAEGLATTFPKLRTLDAVTHNLPLQLTSFVGRRLELAHLADMIGANRLVTLIGIGGCGKTRLALQAAQEYLMTAVDGVFFCDLSRVSADEAVVPAVSSAVGLDTGETATQVSASDAVRNYLARRRTLLVLDNCEHVVAVVAELVEDLLTSSPELKILATSREPLEVPGEQTWSVPSMSASEDAVALFADRAYAASNTFDLRRNERDVRAICERLDGIPLAIELAAAQVTHLAPSEIAERLDHRFMTLTGGRRRIQRQQTLQAAMDWSWDLLDGRDRIVLRRVAVFQGGWSLKAAEAVCDDLDVVGGLRSLVAKSLVVVEQRATRTRYRLLEPVRLYAEEKLQAAGESEAIRSRHRDFFVAWGEELAEGSVDLLYINVRNADVVAERENVRAALLWSQAEGRWDLLVRLLTATAGLQRVSGEAELRNALFDEAKTKELDDELRGRLLACVAYEMGGRGDPQAAAVAGDAIALLPEAPSMWLVMALIARSTRSIIDALISRDPAAEDAAIKAAQHSADVTRALHPAWEPSAFNQIGNALIAFNRVAEAADAFAAGLERALATSAENPPLAAGSVDGLRIARHVLGTGGWPAGFDSLLERVESVAGHVPFTRMSYALVQAERGQLADALASLHTWHDHMRDIAPPIVRRIGLVYAAAIAGLNEEWDIAARSLAASMADGLLVSSVAYALYNHWLPKVRDRVTRERARELRDGGRRMSVDDAYARFFEAMSGKTATQPAR